jgi:hypothetical protein
MDEASSDLRAQLWSATYEVTKCDTSMKFGRERQTRCGLGWLGTALECTLIYHWTPATIFGTLVGYLDSAHECSPMLDAVA